ncbi:unnamed protein product, partial [Rotaria sp. Silwood2]
KILFSIPNPPHYTLTSHKDYLLWLPFDRNSTQETAIPCMLYSPEQEARFFLIWCHGTAEDIGTRHMTFVTLSRQLQTHILVFEYPSYGLSNGVVSSPSEASINDRAQRVYLFICHTIKWPTDRIIIYGHSLGSGPACHLASTQSVGGLILQSPYTSIKNL